MNLTVYHKYFPNNHFRELITNGSVYTPARFLMQYVLHLLVMYFFLLWYENRQDMKIKCDSFKLHTQNNAW